MADFVYTVLWMMCHHMAHRKQKEDSIPHGPKNVAGLTDRFVVSPSLTSAPVPTPAFKLLSDSSLHPFCILGLLVAYRAPQSSAPLEERRIVCSLNQSSIGYSLVTGR